MEEHEKVKKPFWKKWWFWLIIIIILLFSLFGNDEEDENTNKDSNNTEIADQADEQKEEKDELEENTEPEVEEEPDIDIKSIYVDEVKSSVDEVIARYDEIWANEWKITFSEVSDGSVNILEAYNSMEKLKEDYHSLYNQINDIPIPDEFSEEQKEFLDKFKQEMKYSVLAREEAGELGMEMFKSRQVTPEIMNNIEDTVARSDQNLLSAITSLTQLEMELGVERSS